MWTLCAAISIWSLYLYFTTEVLSVNNQVTEFSLKVTWGIADAILLFFFLSNILLLRNTLHLKKISFFAIFDCKKLPFYLFLLFSIYLLYVAFNIVPYNWDSMTYHLTRIIAWADNQSVAHYATTIKRTVSSPVFGEFVNLHVYILSGNSDKWLNFMQCFSFIFNIVIINGISKKIGCTKETSLFASFLFLCTPIAFAEAFTTQVDEFSTLWLLIFVYEILDLIYERKKLQIDKNTFAKLGVLGLSAGFGYLTKPSIMIGIFIFTIWLFAVCINRHDSIKAIILCIVFTGMIALLIISPEIIRNMITFDGAISDPWQGKGQIVHSADPRYLLISFLKNLFFNLPSIYWPNINSLLEKVVYWIAYILNVDADNIAISESGRAFTLTQAGEYGCDSAISPVPTIIMLLCIVIFLYQLLFRKRKMHGFGYSSITIATFMLMCVIIRWEPWIGRYQLSYFDLISPAIALQVQKMSSKENVRGFIFGFIFMMSLTELLGLVRAEKKIADDMSIKDREENYYYYNENALSD